MIRFLAACGLVTAMFLTVFYVDSSKNKYNLNSATDAVVHILPGEGHCTGWYIDDPVLSDGIQTTIMTAKHCLRGVSEDGNVWARMDDYILGRDLNAEIKPFKVFSTSKNSDLTLLQSKDWVREGPTLKLADAVDIGSRVYAVGYPLGLGLMVTEGTVWNLEMIPRGVAPIPDSDTNEFRQVATMVSPGNSGGPLLDRDYNVIGSASLIVGNPAGSHIAFYTDLEDIRDFLRRVTEKYDTQTDLDKASKNYKEAKKVEEDVSPK